MHTHKFDHKGSIYSKARPDYPEALFWYLMAERIIDPQKVVADIGSGTGIFTNQVAPFVKTVYAVEPNADMRHQAEKSFSAKNIISINATAESTSLSESSVDAVAVAQAFHWFDRSEFKKECKRILTPNGKVVLIWNDRDTTADIIQENFSVNKRFCPEFKGSSNGIDLSEKSFSDFFEGEFEVTEFENTVLYKKDTFIERNLSSSYAPKEFDEQYKEYIDALESTFDKYCSDEIIRYPYITRCYIGNV